MRLFLLGATPSFDVRSVPAERRLSVTGGNTGNQLIAHGLLKPLRYESVEWNHSLGPRYVNENCDLIIIAAANFLFHGFDFGGMAEFIEQTRLPVVMVGLGAQAKDYSTQVDIHPGTERLMRVVAERSKLIGVRGAFTQEVLNRLGIRNTQIVGCPSYYMNGPAGIQVRKDSPSDRLRVAVNGSRDVLAHSFDGEKMSWVVRELVREAIVHDGVFIAQTETEEIILAEAAGSPEAVTALERYLDFAAGIAPAEKIRDWATRKMRVFWDVASWIEAMGSFDLAIGTRFHGAMAAIQSGIPGFVFCHDTRTTEMCQFLGVPHSSIVDVESIDAARIRDAVDIEQINGRSAELIPYYRGFLDENGLPHSFGEI